LAVHETGHIARPAEQLDVRVAPDHTGPGAGRIEQDGIEALAVPPASVRGEIRVHQPCLAPQAP
jgi:hypothetical protein